MKKIDTRGKLCPQPLMMTRKALEETVAGEELLILTDNETACGNLKDYLTELKLTFECHWENGQGEFRLTKPTALRVQTEAEAFCKAPTPNGQYVVVIKSDKMGDGDEALGTLLLRAFINTLSEAPALPAAVIFYNSGIRLTLKGSDTIAALEKLEEKGVLLIACGTCLDYYGVKDQLSVGIVSNMYKITELVTQAGHVVYP